jgi:PilZ domain-containing protein
VAARPPDVSRQGMFINTTRNFPEGAVLNLRFRLALTRAEIHIRCEVRYCLPGVGVGVEFIGISPEAVRDIERETELCGRQRPRRKTAKTK